MVESTNFEEDGDDGFDEDAWDEYGQEDMIITEELLRKKSSIQEGKVYIKNKEYLPYTIRSGDEIAQI